MAVNVAPAEHQHQHHADAEAGCPVHHRDARKTIPEHEKQTTNVVPPRYEIDDDGVWHVHGYDEARQILRSDFVKQAGFQAERILSDEAGGLLKNQPIIYLEGDEHHRMRRETNKFFTPTVTDREHREMMEQIADELVEKVRREKRINLSDVTMEMALRVAGQIVGLTDSLLPGMGKRLNGLLDLGAKLTMGKPNPFTLLLSQRYLWGFLFLDVKPAIRARRKNPQGDVISYLIDRGYSDLEMLTECVVYGAAGMATTREFICIALWHFLENPALRQRMLVGEQQERYAILHEILRLEPIIGHLQRRTTAPLDFVSEGRTVTIPAGTLVDVNLYASNADMQTVGESPLDVCPARPLTSEQGKVPEPVLSFGDGYHRCPGAFVAIQESDIFLRKMLAIDTLRIERKPSVTFSPIVKGYEVRNFILVVD